MRIVYLTQSYPSMISGAALVVENLANGMAASGHQVLVIAASDKGPAYSVHGGNLTLLRLKSRHNPMRVGQRFILYPRDAVIQALREFKPDIIHAHEALPMSLPGIIYAGAERIPIALTVHQHPATAVSYFSGIKQVLIQEALWSYARWFTKKFTTIITPTETTSTEVRKILGRHVVTISNGIDLQTFHPRRQPADEAATRQKWNLPPDVPILLHVGRLDVDKRVERVIQASAQVLRETDAHLLIVGDGVRRPALMDLCDSLGIFDRVHFTGFVSAKQGLPEIYRIASLFVYASEIEAQGIVLLEAAASGLPIVAVRATCIPETVHDGVNGFLAEPGDLAGLSQAMEILLHDQEMAVRMGEASQAIAQQHDNTFTIEAHDKLYHQLVEQGRTSYPNVKEGRRPVAEHA
ncbi:MAG TPA: glycosyltransferase [Anaerolineales bacterium]|nr:glycosyltransferase [Anaerolineales bacterium]